MYLSEKWTHISLISATAPLSSNALAMKKATSAFHTWECYEKYQISVISAARIRDITSFACLCCSLTFTTCVLYQQIKKEYGSNVVPAFPPKKIFTLTPAEVEQRREQLEKYMQAGMVLMWDRPFSDDTICVLTAVVSELTSQLRLRSLLSGLSSPHWQFVLCLNAGPPLLSSKCLHNNQCGVFSGHIRAFFWKELMILQKASFKMYRFEWNGGLSRLTLNSPTNKWISITGSNAEGLF